MLVCTDAQASAQRSSEVAFVLGLICLPMIALGNMLDGIARSRSWIIMTLTPSYIIHPFLVLLFILATHASGLEASATTAIGASIAATWITAVGRAMKPQDVAIYFTTTKIMALAHFVYFAVKAGVAPRNSDLPLHSENHSEFARFAEALTSWKFWPSLFLGTIILYLGYLLLLYGSGFTQGYPPLFILFVGVIVRASVGPVQSLLNMSGKQNICALLYALTLAVNIALNLILIPHFGLMGAAFATTFSMLLEAFLLSTAVYKTMHITMFILKAHRPSRKETL